MRPQEDSGRDGRFGDKPGATGNSPGGTSLPTSGFRARGLRRWEGVQVFSAALCVGFARAPLISHLVPTPPPWCGPLRSPLPAGHRVSRPRGRVPRYPGTSWAVPPPSRLPPPAVPPPPSPGCPPSPAVPPSLPPPHPPPRAVCPQAASPGGPGSLRASATSTCCPVVP